MFRWHVPNLAKGKAPFREEVTETSMSACVLVLISDLLVDRVASRREETFRCTPCDLDRIEGSPTTIFR